MPAGRAAAAGAEGQGSGPDSPGLLLCGPAHPLTLFIPPSSTCSSVFFLLSSATTFHSDRWLAWTPLDATGEIITNQHSKK